MKHSDVGKLLIVCSRAGASYFRLVRPLRCEQVRGVWGDAPPGKN